MSGFLTPYRVELLEVRGDVEWWRLLAPLRYASDLAGRAITVPADFEHDGESVPRRIWSFTGGPPCRRSGTLHDWLYDNQAIDGEPIERDLADLIYEEACISEGLDPIYARQRYNSVSVYGESHWAS